jgi:predicted nuclease of predicted toxin-antitoxin system
MNIVADEGVDLPIVVHLRQDGHNVVYIAEESPSITDDEVLMIANDRTSVLLTIDKDFGELVFRLNRVDHGVVLVRLEGLHSSTKAAIVAHAFRDYGSEMDTAFSVIGPGTVRIRKKTP